jgi:hypothetical protein
MGGPKKAGRSVHCKSQGEIGVQPALQHCANQYTAGVLNCSGAAIFVFVGAWAKSIAIPLLGLDPEECVQGPLDVFGLQRMVVFLPHSNSWGSRTFGTVLEPDELNQLRQFLAQA